MEERAKGADVRIVYSPLDAVALAARNPDKKVIFLGVGFETTAPTIAGSILTAAGKGLSNYFVLSAHKTIPIPMQVLSADPELSIDGYLCPAHVSAIIGADAYRLLAEEQGVPCVVTGFEPVDVMKGVEMLVASGGRRSQCRGDRVQPGGQVGGEPEGAGGHGGGFCPLRRRVAGDRGDPRERTGNQRQSMPRLMPRKCSPIDVEEVREHQGCRCGDILKGKVTPFDCPLFATACTPEAPVGACMVSSEGTCAAAYKYGRERNAAFPPRLRKSSGALVRRGAATPPRTPSTALPGRKIDVP